MKQVVALLAGVVAVLMFTNAWTFSSNRYLRLQLRDRDAQIAQLAEARKKLVARQAAVASRPSAPAPQVVRRPAPKAAAPPPRAKAKRDLPEGEDLEEIRDRFWEGMLDNMLDVVAEISAQRRWSVDTTADVMAVFEAANLQMADVRADVAAGRMTRPDGREEMLLIREAASDELGNVLAPGELDLLRERMWKPKHP